MIFDVLLRLEPDPHQRDLARGWAAELADPVWLLGRQWQMGEHQGEDASSPVRVDITSRGTAIEPLPGQPGLDPATVPAEAVLESEPGDWWTPGRRVRAGRLVAASAESHGVTLTAEGSVGPASAHQPGAGVVALSPGPHRHPDRRSAVHQREHHPLPSESDLGQDQLPAPADLTRLALQAGLVQAARHGTSQPAYG